MCLCDLVPFIMRFMLYFHSFIYLCYMSLSFLDCFLFPWFVAFLGPGHVMLSHIARETHSHLCLPLFGR
jgi:hypothetical protein